MLGRLVAIMVLTLDVAPVSDGDARIEAGVPAASEDDPAERAAELYRDGHYAAAAAAFEEAYVATGNPSLLFGRAQSLRRGGNCHAAIEVFEQYIATSPARPDQEEAERLIADCREILGDGKPPPVSVEPPALATQTDAPPPAERPRSAWHRDVVGGVLLGTGLAITVGGAATYGSAFARARDDGYRESQYESRERSVRSLAIAGATLMAAGSALVVGAVIRYVITARAGSPRSRSPWPRRRGRRRP